ncbi:hypothetical protein KCU65_g153, partial [Aureobasidium melanogenum]
MLGLTAASSDYFSDSNENAPQHKVMMRLTLVSCYQNAQCFYKKSCLHRENTIRSYLSAMIQDIIKPKACAITRQRSIMYPLDKIKTPNVAVKHEARVTPLSIKFPFAIPPSFTPSFTLVPFHDLPVNSVCSIDQTMHTCLHNQSLFSLVYKEPPPHPPLPLLKSLAFWLRSSVVSVLHSLIAVTGLRDHALGLLIIFRHSVARIALLRADANIFFSLILWLLLGIEEELLFCGGK